MTTGKLILTGIFALLLAIGASSTAAARPGFSFGFSTGAPALVTYPAYPAYFYGPAPVVANPYPYYYTPAYPVSYPAAGTTSFSFGYHSR